jgi:peptidoglycan/LPS O-acetylase OafA/YrhL
MLQTTAFADSKPHYAILDGLRGVAALLVVWYHIHEGFAFAGAVNGVSDGSITSFNHGYLAVDFFFILSGFVIGYAYDDRWKRGFTRKAFFRRRLIRLHPMVVMGAVLGVVCFMIQGGTMWDGTEVPDKALLLALLLAMLMIPVVPGSIGEVRGNGEMFPLNGPTWSLFFEYIGNILYALFIHRLSTRVLTTVTMLLGALLAWFALFDISGYDMLGVGWTLDSVNFFGGLLRMMFPYTLGMLLARKFSPARIRGAFWWCSLVLLLVFAVPYLKADLPFSLNGLYEMSCVMLVFPLLVWLGASGLTTDKRSKWVCNFLGRLSYPLYLVHYPIFYIFYAWLIKSERYTLASAQVQVVGVLTITLLAAIGVLQFYDEPVRKWLARRK